MAIGITGGASANLFRIPQFLSAPSKEDLVRLMLSNNLKHGIEFHYFDIQKDGRNWVAWYKMEIPKGPMVRNAVGRGNDGPS